MTYCLNSRHLKKLVVVILIFLAGIVSAQKLSTENKKARKLFLEAQDAYSLRNDLEAIKLLQGALAEDSSFFEGHLLAADIYKELDSTRLQITSLEKAAEINISKYPKIFYVLGNAYLKMGNYGEAKNAFESYINKNSGNHPFYKKSVENVKRCKFALSLMNNPVDYEAENLGKAINTDFDEYWPSLTIDGKTIIFTRLSPSVLSNQQRAHFQEDFYMSSLVDGKWEEAKPLKDINTPYNEGAQSVSADGKLIFFTACTQTDGYGSCDIYFTQKIDNYWTKPKNVGAPVNSASWESQPAISANGEYLYFVSNRAGGVGGMDLWRCRLKGARTNGSLVWGKPENLGEAINTKGNEMSPFIHSDSKTLYFASDYWPGMGGLDIFYSRLKNDTVWQKATNLGYPINTHKDEQGLIVDASGRNAYYSSNRPGSKGLDIYRFELFEKARPNPVSYVKGKVIDEEEYFPVCAKVELIDVEANKLTAKTIWCDGQGEFMMCLPLGKEYAFNVSGKGYLFFSENFSLKEVRDVSDPKIMEIKLKRIKVGNSTVLRNIFFKTNSYELLKESIAELELLKGFLANNPTVKIEIGGHTDTIGTEKYNNQLSEKRASAVYKYLLDHGVNADRLSFKGYGWSKPIDTNETAGGRAKNRRTEFRILSLK